MLLKVTSECLNEFCRYRIEYVTHDAECPETRYPKQDKLKMKLCPASTK